jgi:septal ring factor EnvC (AmiA/AmiB activator)
MNPTELHLFSDKEQTLLVATEPARLSELSEDELDALLTLVRRARNKYTKLYRRQSSTLVSKHSSRSGTSTSNQRTKRKAEIMEDALARVAAALAKAARATAKALKAERLEAARSAAGSPRSGDRSAPRAASSTPAPGTSTPRGRASSPSRKAARTASGARSQARRDS